MTHKLNALRARIHLANVERGSWRDHEGNCTRGKRSIPQALCLIHSEVSEAMEGARKRLMDDKLPHRLMLEVELADVFIRGLDLAGGYNHELPSDSEYAGMVDDLTCFIGIAGNNIGSNLCMLHYTISKALDAYMNGVLLLAPLLAHTEAIAIEYRLDLYGAIEEKLVVNATRADHDPANRAQPGGKTF